MANNHDRENNQPDVEEEFNFDDTLDEGEHVESVSEAFPQRKGMMLPVVLGLVVLGFIAWKIYPLLSPAKSPQEEIRQSENIVVPPPKVSTPLPAEQNKVAPSPDTRLPAWSEAEQNSTSIQINQQLLKLQTKVDNQEKIYKQQIMVLHRELQNVETLYTNTQKTMMELQQNLVALSSNLQEVSAQINAIRAQKMSPPKSTVQAKPNLEAKSTNLVIYAIIPGRAWLRSATGKTITVTEGDTLTGYGKILKIDAANAVVLTTSGVSIR